MVYTHRRLLASLAVQLHNEGEREKALDILNLAERELPSSLVAHEAGSAIDMGNTYIQLGETEKAREILSAIADEQLEYINWYNTLDNNRFTRAMSGIYMHVRTLQEIIRILENGGDAYKDLTEKYVESFGVQYERMRNKV